MAHERLRPIEEQLAKASFSSAHDWAEVRNSLQFSESLDGLTILDIGSGASSIPQELAGKGARVIAIDYRYTNLDDLNHSVDTYLQDFLSKTKDYPSWKRERIERYIAQSKITKENWFASKGTNKNVLYVAGTAGNLPLRDNSIDFAFSEQSISKFLIEDYDVFFKAFQEVTRVLKPGGEFQMHPWYTGAEVFTGGASLEVLQNAGQFMHYLRSNGIKHALRIPENGEGLSRLHIWTPAA